MERKYEVGQHVKYVDEFGKEHNAVVTIWWDNYRKMKMGSDHSLNMMEGADIPGCNLVYVTNDQLKTDTYGSQIERQTSVVHRENQAAPGRYWFWPDEV